MKKVVGIKTFLKKEIVKDSADGEMKGIKKWGFGVEADYLNGKTTKTSTAYIGKAGLMPAGRRRSAGLMPVGARDAAGNPVGRRRSAGLMPADAGTQGRGGPPVSTVARRWVPVADDCVPA